MEKIIILIRIVYNLVLLHLFLFFHSNLLRGRYTNIFYPRFTSHYIPHTKFTFSRSRLASRI